MAKSVFECKFLSTWYAAGPLLPMMMSACGATPPPAPAAVHTKLPDVAEVRGVSATPTGGAQPPATNLNQLASPPSEAHSGAQAPVGQTSTSQGISRTLLDKSDLRDLPGWETRMYLIEYAPGAAAPRHHHPVAGVGYVLSGSFESSFEGGATTEVHEGQSFRDLPNVSHLMFKNTDATKPLKFVISYVVRKDAPVLVVP